MPAKRTPDIKPKTAKAPSGTSKNDKGKNEKAAKQREENLRLKEEIKTLKKSRDLESTFSYNYMPYILLFLGLFLGICFIIPEKMGFIGYLVHFLCGLLSAGAAFLPVCLIVEALLWKNDMKHDRLKTKALIDAGFVASVSVLTHLVSITSAPAAEKALFDGYRLLGDGSLYELGKLYKGGGVIGGVLANVMRMITDLGAWIIAVFAVVLLAFAVLGITPLDIAAYLRERIKSGVYNARVRRKEDLRRQLDREKQLPLEEEPAAPKKKKAYLAGIGDDDETEIPDKTSEKTVEPEAEATRPQADPDNVFDADECGDGKPEFPALAISPDAVRLATGSASASFDAVTEDEAVTPDPAVYDSIKDRVHFTDKPQAAHGGEAQENAAEEGLSDKPLTDANVEEINLADIFTEDAVIAAAGVTADTSVLTGASDGVGFAANAEDAGEKQEVKVEPKPDPAELYRFPDIDFLQKDPNPATFAVTDEIKSTSVKLVETLANFGVKTKITNICCGPTVTRYELQPEIGVRVKSIQNLSDDIALHLAAAGVRIEAPIPGKQAVGIEIPNKTVSTVYIRNLIENPKFAQQKSRLSVCLGMDVAGSPVYMDIAKMPHLLIAGATGMGKSVCINSFIVSLLYKARPDECRLLLIDPKKVEFGVYNGMPHLLVPVVSDPKKAAGSLAWAVNEMERRFQLIEEVGVRDIDSYNKATENDPEKEHMPKVVIIIDELADLMMTARDSVENSICRIAQKARAAGMHLVIGTQRPSVDVITGLIKANVPSRIACTVASQVDSRTIIDVAGAEKLLGRGDMLYAPVGSMKPIRVQGSFVTDNEIEKIIDFLKSGSEAVYDSDIIDSIEREAEHCGEKKKGRGSSEDGGSDEYDSDDRDAILDSDDAMFDAIKVAVDANMISTSLLQRKLSLGYSRAARIVDKLEKLGIVGPFEGSKPRKVLITPQEYLELKMNHGR